jgi:ABC-type multidrug transport system ATPase subunit
VIALAGVSKTYRTLITRREVRALADLTLTLVRGEVVGIAGPNGAGKSTLISLILGFATPTGGLVRLEGLAPRQYIERTGVGYLPELVTLPPRWTVREALIRRAVLGGHGPRSTTRALELAAQLGLEEHLKKQVRQVSKGNLQRLGLAQALLDDSDLLILDEPTHGLDPLWTQRFRDLVAGLRRPGRLILIASHNLDELERLADRVVILHLGRLQHIQVAGGTHAHQHWRLVLPTGGVLPEGIFEAATPVEGRPGSFRILGDIEEVNLELERLLAAGGRVASFGPETGGLESAFRSAVGEGP